MLTSTATAAATAAAGTSTLTCLTANLASYLDATEADPLGRIARSVRLAVCAASPPDSLAFSHHAYSLGHLGNGRFLHYRSTSDVPELLARLDEQIGRYGSVLVVTYAGTMAWSLAQPADAAPHFTRVTAHAGGRWHVDDAFTALLPAGPQPPYHGWVSTADLARAMTAPKPLEPQHRLRQRHVFGVAVDVPDGTYRWLEPAADDPATDIPRTPRWTVDQAAALDRLGAYFAEMHQHPDRSRFIDDVWAAAQHHLFRYAHLLEHCHLDGADRDAVAAAVTAWTGVTMSLHFAADSVARGRARPSLVTTVFGALAEAERRCQPVLSRYGYRHPVR